MAYLYIILIAWLIMMLFLGAALLTFVQAKKTPTKKQIKKLPRAEMQYHKLTFHLLEGSCKDCIFYEQCGKGNKKLKDTLRSQPVSCLNTDDDTCYYLVNEKT
jgi:hypothetical protein